MIKEVLKHDGRLSTVVKRLILRGAVHRFSMGAYTLSGLSKNDLDLKSFRGLR